MGWIKATRISSPPDNFLNWVFLFIPVQSNKNAGNNGSLHNGWSPTKARLWWKNTVGLSNVAHRLIICSKTILNDVLFLSFAGVGKTTLGQQLPYDKCLDMSCLHKRNMIKWIPSTVHRAPVLCSFGKPPAVILHTRLDTRDCDV